MSTELHNTFYAASRYLAARQKILSQNIANSDTPRYVAKDLKNKDFSSGSGFSLFAADGVSYTTGIGRGVFRANEDKSAYEITPDGNRVSLEQQFIKVSETQEKYALVNGLMRKWKSIKSTAMGHI